ncbi:MAG: GNAT family N-acetyltransferase [Nocardiopsaceae bacterium]|nr:GNAT family N-acetyltransferase [Nocardiopsaceae bacterium]
MSQSVTLTELGPADFRPAIGQFVAVYAAATNPPERMLAGRGSILERHAAHPGFRALAAVAPGDGKDGSTAEIAGFTYGFHGAYGQWWHDMVAGALAAIPASRGAMVATDWLDDSFEVAELHVLPAYQGAGIGRSLLLRLLSGRPERTALLSTRDAESKARRLYRGVGFTDLLTGFRFSGGEPPYAVMGATLPLHPEDQRPSDQRPDTAASSPPPSPPSSPRPSI